MTELAIIALVVFAVIMALMIAVYFFRLGEESASRRYDTSYQPAPSQLQFVQRLPGDECGNVYLH